MPLRILLLLTLALAACSPKHSQTTWTNAHWGMMRSEVSTAVPGLVGGTGDHLANGATADLRLEQADVAGTTLPANFFFLDGRLEQIGFGDSKYRDNADNAKSFDRIAAKLRSQYGQETTRPPMDPSAGLGRESDWTTGDTQISLVVTPVTGATSMLVVNYRRVVK